MTTAMSAANDAVEKSWGGARILTAFTIAHGIFHFMENKK